LDVSVSAGGYSGGFLGNGTWGLRITSFLARSLDGRGWRGLGDVSSYGSFHGIFSPDAGIFLGWLWLTALCHPHFGTWHASSTFPCALYTSTCERSSFVFRGDPDEWSFLSPDAIGE
jgi:hypothetical protein